MNLKYFAEMAARSADSPARWRRPFLRLLDGVEKGWAIPAIIIAFAAIWLVFFIVAYLSNDLHQDVMETWLFGREFAWGSHKHPPLMGWVAALWTLVFPLTDWSFQLLAMTNAAVALWAVDLVTRRFVRGDKRAIVLLLVMLLPAYQFHAQRFNANTVLLAVWPLAIYAFLRLFEARALRWAVISGVLSALAMLGKYYSIFLLLSFLFAAIAHPQRAQFWRSWAPWVSTLTGLIVLAPHIYWLSTTGAQSFGYAVSVQAGIGFSQSLTESWMFLAGVAATLALPGLVWLLTIETRILQARSDFRAMSPELWLLFLICIGTIVLPAITSVAMHTNMPSLWALQGLFMVVIIVVCGARFEIQRLFTVNLLVMVFAIAVVAVTVAAPIHARLRNGDGANDRTYYRLIAKEVTQRWKQAAGTPLPAVRGHEGLAMATAFYGDDHAKFTPYRTFPATGGAFICLDGQPKCLNNLELIRSQSPDNVTERFTVQPRLWGQAGKPADVVILLVLPQSAARKPAKPAPTEDFSSQSRN